MATKTCPFFDSRVTPQVSTCVDYADHPGMDIMGLPKEAAMVIAPWAGRIVEPGVDSSYGNQIDFVPNEGPYAGGRIRMAHLAYIQTGISVGMEVAKGTQLGLMGKTGNVVGADGRHLHIEYRPDGTKWGKPTRPPEELVGMPYTSIEIVYDNDYIPEGSDDEAQKEAYRQQIIALQNHINTLNGKLSAAQTERGAQYTAKQQKEAAEQAEYVRLRATETTADALIATTTADMGNVETGMTEMFGL